MANGENRLTAMWPVFVSIGAVALAAGIALANVTKAQERADEAFAKASSAVDALTLVNIRLERIQTILERIESQRK